MARGALALPSLFLLLVAAFPTAHASVPDSSAAADLSGLATDTEGCIGPKLRGDQALIAHPYPGGGFEVFAGVNPGTITTPMRDLTASTDALSGAASGGDYVGVGAYVLGPGCEMPDAIGSVA